MKRFLQKYFDFWQPFAFCVAAIIIVLLLPINDYLKVVIATFFWLIIVYLASEIYSEGKMPWDE